MSMVQTKAAKDTTSKWWEQKAAVDEAQAVQSNTKSIQTITFNTSSFNDKDRTFVAIASTPVVDRYGDTIMQEGWNLENFLKNPVVPWAHDYWQPPVARVVEIGINEQGNLQFKYQAPPKGIYPFADTIWELYRNQFMFAFSVGFSSIEAEGDWQSGYEFKSCELLEISAVVVPANPQAVALALDKGFIDQTQLKDLKAQLADGIKNVDKLIAKQVEATDKKDKTEAKDGETTTVKVSLDAEQVKELVDSVNKAAERLEAAAKAANADDKTEDADAGAEVENTAEKDADAEAGDEGLTTDATIDDTKGMSTKAGASLSKANKDKLKAVHADLADMAAKCQTHMDAISAMIGTEDDGKAAEDVETKAVEQKDGEGEQQATDGQEQAAEDTAKAAEGKEDEQQQGDDDAGKGEGEVNSEADKKADEGADQGEAEKQDAKDEAAAKTAEDEELVDPDNLTPEQAEKIAAAVNEELDKSDQ